MADCWGSFLGTVTTDIVPAMQGLRAQTTLDIKQEMPSGMIASGEFVEPIWPWLTLLSDPLCFSTHRNRQGDFARSSDRKNIPLGRP